MVRIEWSSQMISHVTVDTHTHTHTHTHTPRTSRTHTQHTQHTQRERRVSDKCARTSRTGWQVSSTTAAKHTRVCSHADHLSLFLRHFLLHVYSRARVIALLLFLSLPPSHSRCLSHSLSLSSRRLSLPPLRRRKGGETAADAASSGQLDGAATTSADGDVGERLPRQAFTAQHPLPVARVVRYSTQ
jgi:hypothetical protein